MNKDVDAPARRLPSLVQICQRVCASNIDYISSLGDDLRYDLVRPILERCNAEQLLRLENASPHLCADTPEVWKDLCYSMYPLAIERYSMGPENEPPSWKDHYFFLKEAEAKRLEEASAKLRNQRLEADERKKEREVKFTDRVPPPKRQRTGWGSSPAPKTLFQKTRSEASKLQKTMYHARIIPPMPQNGKNYNVLPKPASSTVQILPSSSSTNRVTVNKVVHHRPVAPARSSSSATSTAAASPSGSRPASSPSPPKARSSVTTPQYSPKLPGSSSKPPIRADTSTPSEPRPLKPPAPTKRDPMASLNRPGRKNTSLTLLGVAKRLTTRAARHLRTHPECIQVTEIRTP
ncbi:putative RNA polymerase II transcription factor SIII (Elongin) subunit A [Lyophyllum shimeji]|uniref:RNA polymerase II transcription factor SIII (Elongin) subunit A n=1 Tax=Lyophyllum shimeji TaxID=47721 RepID=A0A9P3PF56_LYOSH|nr:putative RNA polymerase II transcription factor SIII (Elongin) subunit A [Lyophyllum shimeji]